MKRIITSLLAAFAIAFAGYSQTTNGPVNDQVTTPPQFLTDVWNVLFGQGLTNLTTAAYGTYTPSIKTWGAGFQVMRNIPMGHGVGTGLGIGVDYYDKNLYAVAADVGLNATMKPFGGNFYMTPFTFIGLGTAFGGSSNADGNLETIAAIGVAFRVVHVLSADFDILGIYGTREGLGDASGVFYGTGASLTWKF